MKLLTPSLLILLIIAGGAVAFKLGTPTKCANVRGDDTLFALTGDVRRIPYAMKLLEYRTDRKLQIVGVGGHQYAELIPAQFKNRVDIEVESKSTYENSLAVREIAIEKNLKRIVIVTTEDHMNRSLLLIRRQLPDATVIPCPVRLQKMPPSERLWRWGMEYAKYIATWLGMEKRRTE
ncbi:MAG: YdcF family protein [Alphaproteobacteria bacterium]|nr:YdcF family protein [Alphaproteobacteria bacterium]